MTPGVSVPSTATLFSYDAVGNTLSVEDPLHRVTRYQYANDDQLLVVTDPAGVETHYVNNVFGAITITRAANIPGQERSRHFEYDDDDNLLREVDELGGEKLYEYDANHNVIKVTDENKNSTSYSYDKNNRVIKITDADGGETTFTYDGNGMRWGIPAPPTTTPTTNWY